MKSRGFDHRSADLTGANRFHTFPRRPGQKHYEVVAKHLLDDHLSESTVVGRLTSPFCPRILRQENGFCGSGWALDKKGCYFRRAFLVSSLEWIDVPAKKAVNE